MTNLLQQAIAEIQSLPADQQDAIASRILAELADEKEWATRFQATTDQQWDRLAEAARREIAAGHVTPFDEVFPRGQETDIKEDARRLVEDLPEGATWDDLMHRIYVRQAIEAGLKDSDAARTVGVSEVRARFGL